ncbi:MAG: CinA family nicotinamide mononucleotide deamidase-related protein [Deltaproteobacteria bacterium]|nr:CinA family nicotinamide mononucleotide deamidase-related protein [Deltaproteobacteria bacterium]
MSSPTWLSFAVLAIGDEVLRGEVVNGNAAFLSDRAFGLGLVPGEHAVVADEPSDMKAALVRLCRAHKLVFVTGGLGPTDDDRTVDVVSAMLGVQPEIHADSHEAMRLRFARHNYVLTPNNERQVRVPSGALPLPNPVGLAPGFETKIEGATVYFMPGVPREMNRIFDDHVVPRLQAAILAVGGMPTLVRTFHVYGMGESHIDHRLAGLIDDVADVSLHYRAAPTECHVRLVLRHAANVEAEAEAQATMARLEAQVIERLGTAVYGVGDETFPQVVQRAFAEAGKTLAFAESCTGGYAGQLFTEEPGASRVFLGAVVSYANAVKTNVLGVPAQMLQEHGAVSEACAAAMAEGARRVLGADVAVSITGIAGDSRDGSTKPADVPGEKPVGTVCFGVATAAGTRAETRLLSGGRERIRRAAAFAALDLARKAITQV